MVRCAAYNCTGVGKSLFRFPTDRDLLKRWLANLKREDFRPNDHSRLCQDHFESPCFERNPDLMEITGVKFKLSLKPDAVPTFDTLIFSTQTSILAKLFFACQFSFKISQYYHETVSPHPKIIIKVCQCNWSNRHMMERV